MRGKKAASKVDGKRHYGRGAMSSSKETLPQQPVNQIVSLVHQIVYEKNSISRDRRIATCEQLQKLLLSFTNVSELNCNWKEITSSLLSLMSTRINIDAKRAVADCVGAIGCLLASQYKEFASFIVDAVKRSPVKFAEEKAYIYRALPSSLQFIGSAELQSKVDAFAVEFVMLATKEFLGKSYSPIFVIPLLDTCIMVAKYFPSGFYDSFPEIVDFAIGWYIDGEQPASVNGKCRQLLIAMKPFFLQNIDFTSNFFCTFLGDWDTLFLKDSDTEKEESEVEWGKMIGHYRSYSALVFVVSELTEHRFVRDCFTKAFLHFQRLLVMVSEMCESEISQIFVEVIDAMWATLQATKASFFLDTAVNLCFAIVKHPLSNWETLHRLVLFFSQIIDEFPVEMSIRILPAVIGEEGILKEIKNSCQSLQRDVASLYVKLLTPKSLPLLQAAYDILRKQLLDLFAVLRENANSFSSTSTVKDAELLCILLLRAFQSLGAVKNSLIAMMGLSPSLFLMLLTETPICEEWFIVHNPACHLALVHAARVHCEKHENFIANSAWLNQNNMPMLTESHTANHFALIIDLLTRLLSIDQLMWTETRLMIMDWVHGVAFGMPADVLQDIVDHKEMIGMRRALLESFLRHSLPKKTLEAAMTTPLIVSKSSNGVPEGSRPATVVRVRHFTLLRRLGVFSLVLNDESLSQTKFVWRVFERARFNDQEMGIGLWQGIPPVIFLSNGLRLMGEDRVDSVQIKIPESPFGADRFKLMTDFLFHSIIPTYCANDMDNGNWMEDTVSTMYSSCMGDVSPNEPHIDKWRWAIAQVAQFCIENRMKTPLGKPLDTFRAFENELRRLATSSLFAKPSASYETGKATAGTSEESFGKEDFSQLPRVFTRTRRGAHREDDDDVGEWTVESRQLTPAEQWWRVRALLETIEMLDKLINFATFGAIFELSVVPQTSEQFFVTNAASCSNLMCRMYLPMMSVAYRNGHHSQVVRLGGRVLAEAKARFAAAALKRDKSASASESLSSVDPDKASNAGPVDSAAHRCLNWMVRALIELGGWQDILGLYAWAENVYGVRLEWIKYSADIAAGRTEAALDGFVKCFNEEEMAENTRETVGQLIVTALSRIRNPDEIQRICEEIDWKSEEELTNNPCGLDDIVWSRVKGLLTFDPPKYCDNNFLLSWDVDTRRQSSELKLMEIARSFTKENRQNLSFDRYDHFSYASKNELLELTRQLGEDAQMLMIADTNSRSHTFASSLHLLATALKDSHKSNHRQIAANVFDPSFLFKQGGGRVADRLAVGQQISSWMENNFEDNSQSSTLKIVSDEGVFSLRMAALARRTKNLRLANRQLLSYASTRRNCFSTLKKGWLNGIDKENNTLAAGNPEWTCRPTVLGVRGKLEAAKLMWAQPDAAATGLRRQAFEMLCGVASSEMDSLLFMNDMLASGRPTLVPNKLLAALVHKIRHSPIDATMLTIGSPKKSASMWRQREEQLEALAKTTFRMADWLEKEPSLIDVALSHSKSDAWDIFAAEHTALHILGPTTGPATELVGALLSVSCKLCPSLAKAHARLGDWAYTSALQGGDDSAGMYLKPEEQQSIRWQAKMIHPVVTESNLNDVVNAVREASDSAALEERLVQAFGRDCARDTVIRCLRSGNSLPKVWSLARARMMSYFDCAVRSYFKYIAECGNLFAESGASVNAFGTIIGALRILRILVRHSDSFHAIIDKELRHSNEDIWRELLPQLFARLNHPVPSVRDTLSALLERIGAHAPHALCFPAIVGATQPIVMHCAEVDDESDDRGSAIGGGLVEEEKILSLEQDKSLMFDCCQRIVRRLEELFPDLVKDVSEFVRELQRINMLNEERWIFALTNLDHEMNRRIEQIERENAKTLECDYLSSADKKEIASEKATILTASVFRILEDLYHLTCEVESMTQNERVFRQTYAEQLKAAFQTYKANKSEPRKAWHPFRQLLYSMAQSQRSSKRSLVSVQTAEISPSLTNLSHSHIPLPGQESKSFSEVVTIDRMNRLALILPTKTRPKKIVFTGSDGKEYPFLFKAQEDLHLDERIMQLLRICNSMLSVKESEWPPYTAQHYSVTPLGSRSGLIQWVDGSAPLFHVYRKWQLRQNTICCAGLASNVKRGAEIDRPCDLFFKRLKAAFDANSISPDAVQNRSKWPPSILNEVVGELINDTPKDLLSRELWLRASSSDMWYRVTERFARSTAVMSMLGSVLGLGDRHLDNVLINLDSGHIVHIDYNVCFDKGRNLRVPETVPFRLTNNMVHALGPTQVEGTFRLSCEHVMEKLRSNKEVLLTILDTFVYDPLVDWAAAQDSCITNATVNVSTLLAVYGSDARPDTWRALTRALFAVRLRELSPLWKSNGERMKHCLSRVADVLEKIERSRTGVVEYGSVVKGKDATEEYRQYGTERVEAGRELKLTISEHHQIMLELRPILRSLAHTDERFRDYLRLYKNYFGDPLIKGHKLLDDDNRRLDLSLCVSLFRIVIGNISSVYDQLLALDKVEKRASDQAKLTSPPGFEDTPSATQQLVQRQNVYARNVSRRVRQKLEGRYWEKDATRSGSPPVGAEGAQPSRKSLNVTEQVDSLIREATSLSNLSLMYEGWTAWV